ncbi:MAG TPA: Fe-S cluster assembly protein SufD [Usitatibacter sp.]|jgi:Fe-S cluster assembly protein SufD
MTVPSAAAFVADFERVAGSLPGAGCASLERLRREALARFAEHGIPTRTEEDWKYTRLVALEKAAFPMACESAGLATRDDLRPLVIGDLGGHRLVFLDGRYAPALSAVGALPAGARLGSLADALHRAPETIEPFLRDRRHQTIFAALNTAFMADGLHLHLDRGAAIEEPIHVLYLTTPRGQAIHPRNLVVAGANSRATLVEHYAGTGEGPYFTNAVTQVFAAEGAAVEHYRIEQEGARAIHVGGVHASQARASRFLSHSVAFGGELARMDITTAFDGEGCEATLDGLYVAGGRQHVDHHTLVDHARPHGTSREHYRGVLDGTARGVFSGKIVVQPGAQRTDARQANHNLLLSVGAEVDTKPQLEIYADDVKCNHGATVGQLDAAQLFYLRSRGMDEAAARALLTHAFARDVIERIRVAALRSRLEKLLLARLPGAAMEAEA